MSKPVLWIVIPCYNEEQVLPITAPMFLEKIHSLTAQGLVSDKSRVLFVNDGSRDKTWELIQGFACTGRALYRHFPKPQPWPPERRAGGADGGAAQRQLRHYHLH